jgi:hypothetical protein
MALASAPLPALAQSDAPSTTRDILKDRIEVGRQSVGMIAMTLQDGHREPSVASSRLTSKATATTSL